MAGWMPVVSAGLGLAGQAMDMFGLGGQNDQNDLAAALAYRQMQEADRAYKASIAGRVDAMGNQTIYDPATNTWQTIASPETKRRDEVAALEEYRRNTEDAALRRTGLRENADRRLMEGQAADALFEDVLMRMAESFKDYDPNAIYAEEVGRATQLVDDAYGDVENSTARQAMRSGNAADMERLVSSLADEKAKAYRANTPSRWQVLQQVNAANQGNNANALQNYNTLATRASNFDDVAFAPNADMQALAASLQKAGSQTPYAAGMSSAALGEAGKNLVNSMPTMQFGPIANQLGSALNGAWDLFGGSSGTTSKSSDRMAKVGKGGF